MLVPHRITQRMEGSLVRRHQLQGEPEDLRTLLAAVKVIHLLGSLTRGGLRRRRCFCEARVTRDFTSPL